MRLRILISCAAFLFPLAVSAGETKARRPNIVFILADDLGWTDAGCYGSKYYETPHIDALAKRGMRFTDAYTAGPNCAPTRAALLTGSYGPRTGIYTVGTGARGNAKHRRMIPVENRTQLPLDFRTVAQTLKDLGYVTGMFGKWHLGNGPGFHPKDRGFDEAIVSAGKHFDFATNPKTKVPEGTYLADFLTDKAVDFISRHKERPFFLYLPHFAVHTPIEARQDLTRKFIGKKGFGGHDNPKYAAMIASVDQSVGRVVATLEKLGLTENTLVIFTSDNGGVGGYEAAGILGARDITDNSPLRGGKGMLYEGGVRVIWIMAWPGRVPAGRTSGEPIISVDLLPTLVEVAGGKAQGEKLDGVSIVPAMKGAKLDREALYWHFPGYLEGGKKADAWRTTPAGSIRVGDWKLVEFFETKKLQLFDLRADLSQKTDLAPKNPGLALKLHDRLKAWRARVNAPMPKLDPKFKLPPVPDGAQLPSSRSLLLSAREE